jgi:hypothetical protein
VELHHVDEIGVTLIGIRMADRQSRYRADESETITIIKIQQNTIFIEDRSKGIGALALCPWRSSHFEVIQKEQKWKRERISR